MSSDTPEGQAPEYPNRQAEPPADPSAPAPTQPDPDDEGDEEPQ